MFRKAEVSLQSVIQELLRFQTADPKWVLSLIHGMRGYPRGALLSRKGSEGPWSIQKKLAAEVAPARTV